MPGSSLRTLSLLLPAASSEPIRGKGGRSQAAHPCAQTQLCDLLRTAVATRSRGTVNRTQTSHLPLPGTSFAHCYCCKKSPLRFSFALRLRGFYLMPQSPGALSLDCCFNCLDFAWTDMVEPAEVSGRAANVNWGSHVSLLQHQWKRSLLGPYQIEYQTLVLECLFNRLAYDSFF